MTVIYVLLTAHFVADFLYQSDWMALNKSKRWDALAWHVLVYGWAFTLVLGMGLTATHSVPSPSAVAAFMAINLGAHFVQDALTSRLTSRLWFVDGANLATRQLADGTHVTYAVVAYNDKRHWFFVAIGFDQLLHYVTLFVTAGWCL